MGKSVLHSLIGSRRPSSSGSLHGLLLLGRSSERKRLLKLCVRKLQSIDDPETFLCRSVLINNTLKTLQTVQREARAKKEAKDAREQQEQQQREKLNAEMDDIVVEGEKHQEQQESGHSELLDGGATAADAVDTDGLVVSAAVSSGDSGAPELLSCDDESYDLGGYNAEDILSDIIVMPPVLSPQLEDMTHMVVPATSSPSISEGGAALSPLLSGHSPLSSGGSLVPSRDGVK